MLVLYCIGETKGALAGDEHEAIGCNGDVDDHGVEEMDSIIWLPAGDEDDPVESSTLECLILRCNNIINRSLSFSSLSIVWW